MREWEKDELDEQISQAAVLIKKLMETPEDCELRLVCHNWLDDHKSYLPDEPKGYDISQLDGNPENLNF